MDQLIARVSELRAANDLLSIEDMLSIGGIGITIFDPFSTLISKRVNLKSGTVIYPNCMILCGINGSVSLDRDNLLNPSTVIQATAGSIRIGQGNTFGPGGFTATAATGEDVLTIGHNGRYNSGANIYGSSNLGNGCRVLGQIAVDGCELEAGGDFLEPDPDIRGAVLKGFGRAKNLKLGIGDVIQSFGMFAQNKVKRQTAFHPV